MRFVLCQLILLRIIDVKRGRHIGAVHTVTNIGNNLVHCGLGKLCGDKQPFSQLIVGVLFQFQAGLGRVQNFIACHLRDDKAAAVRV